MKKYLVILVLIGLTTIAHAQLKVYSAPAIMPDGTRQDLALRADETGASEYLRIARQNVMNIKPISLRRKNVYVGETIRLDEQNLVSESAAYRFLANELCESCSTTKHITKEKGAMLYVRTASGNTMVADVIWVSTRQKWLINFVSPNSEFVSTQGRPIFY